MYDKLTCCTLVPMVPFLKAHIFFDNFSALLNIHVLSLDAFMLEASTIALELNPMLAVPCCCGLPTLL
jgi:hypothetical protein